MAFDRSAHTQLVSLPAPTQPEAAPQQTAAPGNIILDHIAAREMVQLDAPFAANDSQPEKKITLADILFATIITTLSVAAALAGITVALFLIGLGLAIYIVPIIAAVFVSVVATSGLLLAFRKQIKHLAARMTQRAASAQADVFQAA